MTEYELAEMYECADCGDCNFGAWNCLNCGGYHLIRDSQRAFEVLTSFQIENK